jgi:hypothetical protein
VTQPVTLGVTAGRLRTGTGGLVSLQPGETSTPKHAGRQLRPRSIALERRTTAVCWCWRTRARPSRAQRLKLALGRLTNIAHDPQSLSAISHAAQPRTRTSTIPRRPG